MTKVLIIGYVWPEPASSAAGSRMLELIHLFKKQDWEVSFSSPATLSEHMFDLDSIGVGATNIEVNDPSFDGYISKLQPDIVLFDRFMMEEQFGWRVEKNCPSALRLLDTEDLHFLRHARYQAFKQDREVSQQDLFGELAQREIASILRSDLSLIISTTEMQLLEQEFSIDSNLLHYCPFMINSDCSAENTPSFEERQHFISIGNFRHAPNWDSVCWLNKTIWPMIRRALPQAELHVYGAYPPKKATELNNPKQGFLVQGWAPDASEVMKATRICLAPLRFGAGLKGKLIDAMNCGTPNITTPVGAEAMSGDLPWCGFIADNAEDFSEKAIWLYQNQNEWQQAQQHGFAIIEQVFDDRKTAGILIEKINNLMKTLEKHRLSNFTGAMLRHHQHKSTEYMSRWIETKNRVADQSKK